VTPVPRSPQFASIEEIINDARNGRMFVLVDDEDRENEGDLVMPAQMATPDAINFMTKHGRGLVCLALTRKRVEELKLPPMSRRNSSRHETAFTVSIEAREGVTTGISASDRARTIAAAIDPCNDGEAIVSPGHIFPLEARDGGVLVRAGHTEAAVDIARLAGLNPSGVICEIMNDDGTMARTPDLLAFAERHRLNVATIADLIAYRLRHDRIIERLMEHTIDTEWGGPFRLFVYANRVAYAEHLALVMGAVADDGPILVRMHALSFLDDILGDKSIGKSRELQRAMRIVARRGRGVIVIIRDAQLTSLSERVQGRIQRQEEGGSRIRDYGIGAQILLDLGVREMILLTNTLRTVIGLQGYGLAIVGQQPIDAAEAGDRPASMLLP
jgi:3,4-dihydroxy 2-butanone 4-phosphate synthase/GTP cyclohydrolase II